MACKKLKFPGRDVVLEYYIGCGDALPAENDWRRFGSPARRNSPSSGTPSTRLDSGLGWRTAGEPGQFPDADHFR